MSFYGIEKEIFVTNKFLVALMHILLNFVKILLKEAANIHTRYKIQMIIIFQLALKQLKF